MDGPYICPIVSVDCSFSDTISEEAAVCRSTHEEGGGYTTKQYFSFTPPIPSLSPGHTDTHTLLCRPHAGQ